MPPCPFNFLAVFLKVVNTPAMKILCLFAVAMFFHALPIQAQVLNEKGRAEIDALLQRAVEQHNIPGVVAIVAGKNEILYSGAFGLQDMQNQKLMQKDSIFRIASMTKPITSAAVMLLQEQGKLRVDDPVSKYLPAFASREVIDTFNEGNGAYTTRKANGEILIRHLLTHTSGFAYNFANNTVNRLQQITGRQPYDLPLLYDPGTRWTYSNSTTVLGQIVEKISGVRLDEFFGEHFFKPLGMENTFYDVPDAKHDRVVTVAQRSSQTGEGRLSETPNPARISSAIVGEGGLFSIGSDYIRFLQMLLNEGTWQGKTILSKESVRDMTKNQIGAVIVETQQAPRPATSLPFPMGGGRDKFGFGFEITAPNNENPNLRSPGSYSWAGLENTHFWVDPKRQIAAVIFMQVLPFYDDACMKIYRDPRGNHRPQSSLRNLAIEKGKDLRPSATPPRRRGLSKYDSNFRSPLLRGGVAEGRGGLSLSQLPGASTFETVMDSPFNSPVILALWPANFVRSGLS